MLLLDGTNVIHALVKGGWYCWCRKYALGDLVLEWLEKDTRGTQKGLWADPQPVPPWEGRSYVDRDGRRFDFPPCPVCNSTRLH